MKASFAIVLFLFPNTVFAQSKNCLEFFSKYVPYSKIQASYCITLYDHYATMMHSELPTLILSGKIDFYNCSKDVLLVQLNHRWSSNEHKYSEKGVSGLTRGKYGSELYVDQLKPGKHFSINFTYDFYSWENFNKDVVEYVRQNQKLLLQCDTAGDDVRKQLFKLICDDRNTWLKFDLGYTIAIEVLKKGYSNPSIISMTPARDFQFRFKQSNLYAIRCIGGQYIEREGVSKSAIDSCCK